jgi:hypothetical protein
VILIRYDYPIVFADNFRSYDKLNKWDVVGSEAIIGSPSDKELDFVKDSAVDSADYIETVEDLEESHSYIAEISLKSLRQSGLSPMTVVEFMYDSTRICSIRINSASGDLFILDESGFVVHVGASYFVKDKYFHVKLIQSFFTTDAPNGHLRYTVTPDKEDELIFPSYSLNQTKPVNNVRVGHITSSTESYHFKFKNLRLRRVVPSAIENYAL